MSQHRLDYLSDIFGNEITTLYSNSEQIEKAVIHADLVIGAVLVTGSKAPKLVTREMVSRMQPGGVIVTAEAAQGGRSKVFQKQGSRLTGHIALRDTGNRGGAGIPDGGRTDSEHDVLERAIGEVGVRPHWASPRRRH